MALDYSLARRGGHGQWPVVFHLARWDEVAVRWAAVCRLFEFPPNDSDYLVGAPHVRPKDYLCTKCVRTAKRRGEWDKALARLDLEEVA
jgi:hypothetical protein